MPSKMDLLEEGARRGILPPDKQELYDEAVRRGLLGKGDKQAPTRSPSRDDQLRAYADRHPVASKAATFLQGVPFAGEYTDEALGYLGSKMSGNSYEDSRDAIRAMQKREDDENPGTATALRIGGAVAGTVPMVAAGIGPVTKAVGTVAKSPLARAIAGFFMGGSGGATEGAISGYGSGENPDDRIQQAQTRGLIGGAIGAGIGGAVPLIAPAVKAGVRNVAERLGGGNASRTGLSRPAYESLRNVLDADQAMTGAGASRLHAAGPDAMLADAGPSSAQLLDTSIQHVGPGSRIASEAVERRAAQANTRLGSALDDALGAPQGVFTAQKAIRTGTQGARSNAYNAAYNAPIDYASQKGQEILDLFRRIPKSAINRANKLMTVGGEPPSRQIMASIAEDGTVTYSRQPDVRQIDYITRALNDVADVADGQGKLGGTTQLGRAYSDLSRDLRGRVRDLVPEYGVALDTAADAISRSKAIKTGDRLLTQNIARDEAADIIHGMSQAERAAVKQGVRSHIDDTLANIKRAVSDGNMEAREAQAALRELSSRANRDKLGLLLGQDADALFARIDEAGRALELRAAVATNSKTAVRQSTQQAIKDSTEGGVVNALREGRGVNAAQRAWQYVTGGTPEARQLAQQSVYEEIARTLTQPRGGQAAQMVKMIADTGQASDKAKAIAEILTRRGLLTGGALGQQSATQGLHRRMR